MTDANLRLQILDPFEPELIEVLKAGIPQTWDLRFPDAVAPSPVVAEDTSVLFAMWTPVTAEVLAKARDLKLIQKLGAGIDRIDLDFCRNRGIAVAKLAGINAVPVAEHIVMFMLVALRRWHTTGQLMKTGRWFKEEARAYQRDLRGRTVGLIGVGHVGREVARRLRPFGVDALYFDPYRLTDGDSADLGLRYASLEELLAVSDVVSLQLPLTSATRNLIDSRAIASMKRGAVLVNCARGGLVDEAALAKALDEGRISVAALDVFVEEPLGDPSIVNRPDVIASPHSAGATRDNFAYVIERAVANARMYLGGSGLPADDVAIMPES